MARNNHRGGGSTKSLALLDYSDVEFLHIVHDVADADGWSTTHDVAEQTGLDRKNARSCAGARLGYMRRNGWVERDMRTGSWRVTAVGHSLMDGRVPAAVVKALDTMKPGDRVRVTRAIAEGTTRQTDAARTMLRREWRRNVEMRRP